MKKFDYDSIPAGYYDDIYKKFSGVQSSWHYLKFLFINHFIPNENYHLDFGCGPGTFLGNFRHSQCIGVDISSEQIDYANKAYSSSHRIFKKIDSSGLPFEDSTFDSISLIEVVEHLDHETINFVLKECYRCLKKNGTLIISTPNYNSLWPVLEFIVNKLSSLSYLDQHITKFNTASLASLATSHNFKIQQKGSFLLFSPFTAFVSWALSKHIFKLEKSFNNLNIGFLSFCFCEK
jgi:SAM-dependent methyltransferase